MMTRYICFQDSEARVNFLPFTLHNQTSQISVEQPVNLDVRAANGSGLAGATWPRELASEGEAFHLIYVNTAGVLADLYQNQASSGMWVQGGLERLNFKAPTDNRPTLLFIAYPFGGMGNESWGGRLFAGGLDGAVSQFSYDNLTQTWFPAATHQFTDGWAYGSAAALASGNGNYTYSDPSPLGVSSSQLGLYLTSRSGHPQFYAQNAGGDGPDASPWPGNGSWTSAIVDSQASMVNTSFGLLAWDQPELCFWTPEGRFVVQDVNPDFGSQFGALGSNNASFHLQSAIEGSDLATLQLFDPMTLSNDLGSPITYNVVCQRSMLFMTQDC